MSPLAVSRSHAALASRAQGPFQDSSRGRTRSARNSKGIGRTSLRRWSGLSMASARRTSSAARSSQDRLVACEVNALVADRCQEAVATGRGSDLVLPELHHPGLVSGPRRDRLRKRPDLTAPVRSVRVADLFRAHEADVDVAVRPALLTRCAAEEIRSERLRVPPLEL